MCLLYTTHAQVSSVLSTLYVPVDDQVSVGTINAHIVCHTPCDKRCARCWPRPTRGNLTWTAVLTWLLWYSNSASARAVLKYTVNYSSFPYTQSGFMKHYKTTNSATSKNTKLQQVTQTLKYYLEEGDQKTGI